MSKKLAEEFAAKYRPIAEQVGKEIGVDPNIILSQWALESAYGKKIPASNNIAGIQDFSGSGKAAKDPQTGKTAKYVEFEDPETFGMYYADMIKRQFPYAVNTGEDVGAFTRGLVSGRSGSYFEADPQRYATGLASFYNTLPGTEKIEAPVVTQFEGVEAARQGAAQPGAPSAPPQETDEERDARMRREQKEAANEVERRQAQLIGGGVGAGVTAMQGAKGFVGSLAEAAGKRAEAGRQAAMAAAAGASPGGAAPSVAPSSVTSVSAGQTGATPSVVKKTPMGGSGTFNYGKAFGLTDIEAARALDMSKQAGGAGELISQRRDVMSRLPQMFPSETWVENPRYGGLMTLGEETRPRASFRVQGATPDIPPGTLLGPAAPPPQGALVQLPPRQPVPTTPPSSTAGQKIKSGLDTVTGLFKSMMKPVGTVARYAAPPLTLAGAAGEGVNIAQEMGRPSSERDLTSLGLSGLNLLGTGMSFFPATMPIGIPLSIGTAAAQEYRKNPEFRKYVDEKLTGGEVSGGLPVVP